MHSNLAPSLQRARVSRGLVAA